MTRCNASIAFTGLGGAEKAKTLHLDNRPFLAQKRAPGPDLVASTFEKEGKDHILARANWDWGFTSMSQKLLTQENTPRRVLKKITAQSLVRGALQKKSAFPLTEEPVSENQRAVRKVLGCGESEISTALPSLGAVVERIVIQPQQTHVYFNDGSFFELPTQQGDAGSSCGCGGNCGPSCSCQA